MPNSAIPLDRSCHVLIVEDEPLIRMMIADVVENLGLSSAEAANADEAITMLRRTDSFSVLLTDIDMPGSMNGLALAFQARQLNPEQEIIVMSGRQVPSAEMLPDGSRFFPKPLRMNELAIALTSKLRN